MFRSIAHGDTCCHVKCHDTTRYTKQRPALASTHPSPSNRLWDWRRGVEMALFPTASGLPSSVATPKVICRSCCFSPSKPDAVFTLQSGLRGSAYVTQWRYAQAATGVETPVARPEGHGPGPGGERFTVGAVHVKRVSPHPATSMSIRTDGRRLAVANVEGTVVVYRLPGLAKVIK